jgi:outer membrane lipoprotein-sorting protein
MFFSIGCSMREKTTIKASQAPVVLQSASRDELMRQYNQQANDITSLNASVTMQLTAGSAYTGTIDQYHEIIGFILAQKPASIRVIGQVPLVGKNIFDMESDGNSFRIFVPSKNQFIVGASNLERPSAKPIENLRPQHLIDAIFWQSVPARVPVLFEEATEENKGYYVLTIARKASTAEPAKTPGAAMAEWEIDRKIWVDRTDLNITRLETYDSDGEITSDIRYTGWEMFGTAKYARQISLSRPVNDYQIQIGITKLAVNEQITADRFELKQPDGTELVQVGENTKESRP